MAKEIIVLGTSTDPVVMTVDCVFWYPITSGQKATSGSVWSGASTAENTAIQGGSVLEEVRSFQFPVGFATANIKAYLVQYWVNRNTQINGVGPGLYQNVYDDSVTGWSA